NAHYTLPPQHEFLYTFSSYSYLHHPDPPSFPTRRSSDLKRVDACRLPSSLVARRTPSSLLRPPSHATAHRPACPGAASWTPSSVDRKSTRLNSSHLGISYAVFCLKKKKKTDTDRTPHSRK